MASGQWPVASQSTIGNQQSSVSNPQSLIPNPSPAATFDFSQVSAVVMDEFHSFTDPERGIVWELSLGLLPEHVRTLLLSATVGNAVEFLHWLRTATNGSWNWSPATSAKCR